MRVLRSLLLDATSGLPHKRLSLLRIHGIVCPLEGLKLIGEDAAVDPFLTHSAPRGEAGGLRDLVLQLEGGELVSEAPVRGLSCAVL